MAPQHLEGKFLSKLKSLDYGCPEVPSQAGVPFHKVRSAQFQRLFQLQYGIFQGREIEDHSSLLQLITVYEISEFQGEESTLCSGLLQLALIVRTIWIKELKFLECSRSL